MSEEHVLPQLLIRLCCDRSKDKVELSWSGGEVVFRLGQNPGSVLTRSQRDLVVEQYLGCQRSQFHASN